MTRVFVAWLGLSAALGASGCMQRLSADVYHRQVAAERFDAAGDPHAAAAERARVERLWARLSRMAFKVPPTRPDG
jgi:hypothetical protein